MAFSLFLSHFEDLSKWVSLYRMLFKIDSLNLNPTTKLIFRET